MNSNTLNLNIFEKDNIVCVSLMNATMRLNSIEESNVPNLKNCIFFFLFFLYDRNSNLNSHTRIFGKSQGSNPHPYREVRFFGEEDYHWTEYPSG